MMVKPPSVAPLLSRPVRVDDIPDHGLTVTIASTAEERQALAALNKLVALTALTATLLVRRHGRTGAMVTGHVRADVVQTCVVSLDPFEAKVDEPVEVQFLQMDALDAWRAERAKRPAETAEEDDEDEPDSIVDGTVDLGSVVAEHVTLGLDPYPKKPGVRFDDVAPAAPQPDASPFAMLKALRTDEA